MFDIETNADTGAGVLTPPTTKSKLLFIVFKKQNKKSFLIFRSSSSSFSLKNSSYECVSEWNLCTNPQQKHELYTKVLVVYFFEMVCVMRTTRIFLLFGLLLLTILDLWMKFGFLRILFAVAAVFTLLLSRGFELFSIRFSLCFETLRFKNRGLILFFSIWLNRKPSSCLSTFSFKLSRQKHRFLAWNRWPQKRESGRLRCVVDEQTPKPRSIEFHNAKTPIWWIYLFRNSNISFHFKLACFQIYLVKIQKTKK